MSKFDIRRASVGVAVTLILCLVILLNPNSYEGLFDESAAESDNTNVDVNIAKPSIITGRASKDVAFASVLLNANLVKPPCLMAVM